MYGAPVAIGSPVHLYSWCVLCMYLYKNNLSELSPTIYPWIMKRHNHVPSPKGTRWIVHSASMDYVSNPLLIVFVNCWCQMLNFVTLSSPWMMSMDTYYRLTLRFVKSNLVWTNSMTNGWWIWTRIFLFQFATSILLFSFGFLVWVDEFCMFSTLQKTFSFAMSILLTCHIYVNINCLFEHKFPH